MKYKYYYEKINIKNHRRKETIAPIRECIYCGRRDHHLMPMDEGFRYNWKEAKWKKPK